jgi:hypothetical protein
VWVLAFAVLGLFLPWPAHADSRAVPPPPLFRLFLNDGHVVTTYGEYARVDRQVVASVPVGVAATGSDVPLETITLSADIVDWPRSEAYAATVRLALYAASTAERDYAAFTEDVARTLNLVSATSDPLQKITLVTQARERLVAWPRLHYGYRQHDIDGMLAVLDDVLVGLRAAAGEQHFTLTLASGAAAAPPPAALLPAPTLREVVAQVLGISPYLSDPSERMQMLTRVSHLTSTPAVKRESWAREARGLARRQLSAENRISRAYRLLSERMTQRSAASLGRADVRALMTLRQEVDQRDALLGGHRPAEMASLRAHLDEQLDEARRRRLAIERWEARRPVVQGYALEASRVLDALGPVATALEDVKSLAGPSLVVLERLEVQLAGMQVQLRTAYAPEEAVGVHALIGSALQMTASAFRGRRLATLSANLTQAWDASAAAAGALLMLERARTDLGRLVLSPADAGRHGAAR